MRSKLEGSEFSVESWVLRGCVGDPTPLPVDKDPDFRVQGLGFRVQD